MPTPPVLPTFYPTPGPETTVDFSVEAVFDGPNGPDYFTATSGTPADVSAALEAWQETKSVTPSGEATSPPVNRAWALIADFQTYFNPIAQSAWYCGPCSVGSISLTTGLYRLSTNDPNFDYYMLVPTFSTAPRYLPGPGKGCFVDCGFYQDERHLVLALSGASGSVPTQELGPLNMPQISNYSFSIGGSLTGKIGWSDKGANVEGNSGLNVGYSQSWSQPLTTTYLVSSIGDTSALWIDRTTNFTSGPVWSYTAHDVTNAVSNLTNGKVAVFKVPRASASASSVSPYIEAYDRILAANCALCLLSTPPWTAPAIYDRHDLRFTQNPSVPTPTFSIDTTQISVKPGASATFHIKVKTHVTEAPKAWVVVADPSDGNLLITPSSGIDARDGTNSQTITVFSQPNTPAGKRYTLYINTVPAGGAPSLRNGSLLINVTT